MKTVDEDMALCYREIASNIKSLRINNNLTQRQMLKILEIDPQYYARLERGDDPARRFTLDKVLMACGIFEVEPNKLLSKLPSMSKFSTMKEQLQEDISNTMKDLNMEQLAKVKKFVSSMPSA